MDEKDKLMLDSLGRLEHKAERTSDKLSKISEELGKQGITLRENTHDIKEHIKRTNRLEDRLLSVTKKVLIMWNAPKILVGALSVSSAVAGIIYALHKMGVINW